MNVILSSYLIITLSFDSWSDISRKILSSRTLGSLDTTRPSSFLCLSAKKLKVKGLFLHCHYQHALSISALLISSSSHSHHPSIEQKRKEDQSCSSIVATGSRNMSCLIVPKPRLKLNHNHLWQKGNQNTDIQKDVASTS